MWSGQKWTKHVKHRQADRTKQIRLEGEVADLTIVEARPPLRVNCLVLHIVLQSSLVLFELVVVGEEAILFRLIQIWVLVVAEEVVEVAQCLGGALLLRFVVQMDVFVEFCLMALELIESLGLHTSAGYLLDPCLCHCPPEVIDIEKKLKQLAQRIDRVFT